MDFSPSAGFFMIWRVMDVAITFGNTLLIRPARKSHVILPMQSPNRWQANDSDLI